MEKQRVQEVIIRELRKEDLIPDLLKHFNRYQMVRKVWRWVNGEKLLIDNPFIEDWDDKLKEEIVEEDFQFCINNKGIVLGVFHEEKLLGFAALLRDFFGSEKQYVQLMQLHVSSDCRGLGIGRQLFQLCAEKAKQWGAKKLYISGHSAEETQEFYKSVGCVEAEEINEIIASHEPYDIQLEYKL